MKNRWLFHCRRCLFLLCHGGMIALYSECREEITETVCLELCQRDGTGSPQDRDYITHFIGKCPDSIHLLFQILLFPSRQILILRTYLHPDILPVIHVVEHIHHPVYGSRHRLAVGIFPVGNDRNNHSSCRQPAQFAHETRHTFAIGEQVVGYQHDNRQSAVKNCFRPAGCTCDMLG